MVVTVVLVLPASVGTCVPVLALPPVALVDTSAPVVSPAVTSGLSGPHPAPGIKISANSRAHCPIERACRDPSVTASVTSPAPRPMDPVHETKVPRSREGLHLRQAGRIRCWSGEQGPTSGGSSGRTQGSRADAPSTPVDGDKGSVKRPVLQDRWGGEHVPWEDPRRRDPPSVGPRSPAHVASSRAVPNTPGPGVLAPRSPRTRRAHVAAPRGLPNTPGEHSGTAI